jgi:hypothetical protein
VDFNGILFKMQLLGKFELLPYFYLMKMSNIKSLTSQCNSKNKNRASNQQQNHCHLYFYCYISLVSFVSFLIQSIKQQHCQCNYLHNAATNNNCKNYCNSRINYNDVCAIIYRLTNTNKISSIQECNIGNQNRNININDIYAIIKPWTNTNNSNSIQACNIGSQKLQRKNATKTMSQIDK